MVTNGVDPMVTKEDLLGHLLDLPLEKRFLDWAYQVRFEYNGKYYTLFFNLANPSWSRTVQVEANGTGGVFKTREEKALDFEAAAEGIIQDAAQEKAAKDKITVLVEPEWHFAYMYPKKADDYRQEVIGDSVHIHVGDSTVILKPGESIVRLNEKDCVTDLTFTSRAPTFWKGGYANRAEGNPLGEGNVVRGWQTFVDVEGTATIAGEEIKVKGGVGNFEHVWIEIDPNWFMQLQQVDFIQLFFDEADALIMKNLTSDHKKVITGSVYLRDGKVLTKVIKTTVINKGWMYAPNAYSFLATEWDITAETEDGGVLKAVIEKPTNFHWWHHRRMEDFEMNDITGWRFNMYGIFGKATGTYTLKDGRVINLTNGLATNDPQKVSPLL